MKQDRFLVGILIFIGLLVVAALALFFIRKDTQVYAADDSPDHIVQNYVLAVQKQDFQRAYDYLADMNGKPTYEAFRRAYLTNQLNLSTNGIQVGTVQYVSNTEAVVNLTVLYAGGGPFSQGSSSTDRATLVQAGGAWKISYMPYPYWSFDWYQPPVTTALPVKP